MLKRLAPIALTLFAAACASVTPPTPTDSGAPEGRRPMVLIVSIDGFRPDFLDRGLTPTLSRLREEGAWGPMRPAFPTKTFPNHYTLVTGLTPDHHGIINNTMEDPAIPGVTFRLADREAISDPRWWQGGVPIWVTAENAGLDTAVVFWPGSAEPSSGVRPDRWLRFDQAMHGDVRVDRMLTWIGDHRPDFAAMYFDIVDTANHHYGPDSEETNAAMASVDASIARLMTGLDRLGLAEDVVLLIVSDHGARANSPDRVVRTGPAVASGAARVVFYGAISGFEPTAGREAEAEAELLAPQDHVQCWRRAEIPAQHGFGSNPRVPSIFCLSEPGWEFLPQGQSFRFGGDHGYTPDDPEMAAVFIVHGPGVVAGRRLENLDSVDVHAFLGRLLGIPVPADDGNPADTLPVTTP